MLLHLCALETGTMIGLVLNVAKEIDATNMLL